MRKRLGFSDRPQDQRPMNVVIHSDEGAVSLLVDRIGDVIDVSNEAFETPPNTLIGPMRMLIQGAYKLKGKLLLVLDTVQTTQFLNAA